MEKEPLVIDKNKLSTFWKEITLEPTTILFYTSFFMSQSMESMLLLQKACTKPLGANKCIDEINAENIVAGIDAWKPTICTLLNVLIGLFTGPLLDKYPHLITTFLYIPIIGQMLRDSINCVNIYFSNWSTITAALFQTFIPAFSGSLLCFVMICTIYLTHVTNHDNRTCRIAYFYGASSIGSALGSTFSGFAADYIGLFNGFLICVLINFFGVVFGLWLTKPLRYNKLKINIKDLLKFDVFLSFIEVVKNKEKKIKKIIIFIFFGYGAATMVLLGENSVIYLYTRNSFNWSATEFSLYSFFKFTVLCLGSIICASILSNSLQFKDSSIALITCLFTGMASIIILAFVRKTWHFYLSTLLQLFQTGAIAVSSSWITKYLNVDEYGQMCSITAILQGSSLLAYPIYNKVYQLTITTLPSAMFAVSLALMVISTVSFSFASLLQE